ncbi:MAG: amidohydrolase family protein [Lysobacteraceae bacterium]
MRTPNLLLSLALMFTAAPARAESPTVDAAPDGISPYLSFEAERIALIGVTVIDGKGHAPMREQTVLIDDGRIVAIGAHDAIRIPDDAKRLDLTGRTVIPGLVGMHDHSHMPGIPLLRETAPRLWLAAGVTTVQTAGAADAAGELALVHDIDTGRIPGPRIIASAPYVTGPDGNGPMDKPATPDAARAFVRQWSARGVGWFKLYRHVQPDIAAALIDEAHRQGRKVTGHLCSLSFTEAAELGIDRIEHGLISASDFIADRESGHCSPNRASLRALDVDGDAVTALIERLVMKGVVLTSTLAIIESHFAHRPQGDARALAMLGPGLRAAYDRRQHSLHDADASDFFTPDLYARLLRFERRFASAGGVLVSGPDTGRHVIPGFGDQRNVELLVEAGFAVSEAIRIATHNGAHVLGIDDDTGSIEVGKRADLVVLHGDLASNAAVIRNAELVLHGGRAYNPARLLDGLEGRIGAED